MKAGDRVIHIESKRVGTVFGFSKMRGSLYMVRMDEQDIVEGKSGEFRPIDEEDMDEERHIFDTD